MAGLDWLTARPIAHRGLHDAAKGIVENTTSAVARAIDANYGIEVDLQITADGEAVVHHDDALGRLTEGTGRLDAMSAAELARVPFKATGDGIITLGNLCDLVAGRVTLLLELKSHFDGDARLPQRVAAVLQNYAGPVAAMSFDPAQVLGLRQAAFGLPRGITAEASRRRRGSARQAAAMGNRRSRLYDVMHMRPHFIAYSVADLPAAVPLLARSLLGLPLLTWTVRSEADRARAERWADQMIFEGFRP
jgi:glycerophosphoryl diester phosphodiesterase